MSAQSHLRGHIIVWNGKRWVYADDSTPTAKERACKKCERKPTEEGHDACLGRLTGVLAACCGHGLPRGCYVQQGPAL